MTQVVVFETRNNLMAAQMDIRTSLYLVFHFSVLFDVSYTENLPTLWCHINGLVEHHHEEKESIFKWLYMS